MTDKGSRPVLHRERLLAMKSEGRSMGSIIEEFGREGIKLHSSALRSFFKKEARLGSPTGIKRTHCPGLKSG